MIYLGGEPGAWLWARAETHVMALGPPRCGKTRKFMIPNVLGAPGPVISTSTKPDVLTATLGRRSALGTCWLFDPFGEVVNVPEGVRRLRWSPVTHCADWTVAQLVCADLVNAAGIGGGFADPHWRAQALAMVASMMHAAAVGELGIDEVASWINRRDLRTPEGLLARLGDPLAKDVMAGLGRIEAREVSSVFSTASDALAAYRAQPALEAARSPNLAPGRLVESSDTIYICASSEVQELVAPTVVMLIGRAVAARYARTRAQAAVDGKPLLLALDEAANIAPIQSLPKILSEGASQGVLVAACFQDLSQAHQRWGRAAEGFLTQFGGKLIFPGVAQRSSLEALSVLCGEAEVPVRTLSRTVSVSQRRPERGRRNRVSSFATTWSTRRQPALSPGAISRGHPGHALYLEGGIDPSWVPLTDWKDLERSRELPPSPVLERSRQQRPTGLER